MPAPFRKNQRLLTARDYRAVFADTRFKAGQREFLLLARPAGTPWHRLGLAVARKHAARAVTRNRIKRIARERFRHLAEDGIPLDMVFLTRPGAAALDRRTLARDLDRQFRRLLQRAGT
jgi:ribonuclease P protein component